MFPITPGILMYDLLKFMNLSFAKALGNITDLIFIYVIINNIKTFRDPVNNPPDRDMIIRMGVMLLFFSIMELMFRGVNLLI